MSGARKRVQRQVLVTWLYRRSRVDDVAARWTPVLKADDAAVAEAARTLAQATARLLERWGKDAPAATGRTVRQLRSLARQPYAVAAATRQLNAFTQGDAYPPGSLLFPGAGRAHPQPGDARRPREAPGWQWTTPTREV